MNYEILMPKRETDGLPTDKGRWQAMEVVPAEGYVPFDPDPAKGLLLERFERRVRSAPDDPAIVTDEATASLAALNGQANAVAHRVLDFGLPPKSVVALFMAHGPAKVAAAIGVMKAGVAYTTVDPVHNDRGVADLFSHSAASIIVTDGENAGRGRRLVASTVTTIDMADISARLTAQNPGVTVAADDWARVVYTSGSTGTPKAVIRTHGNERDFALATQALSKIGVGDRVAFLQNFWSSHVLGPLIAGATLHPFDLRREGLGAMKAWMQRQEITYCEGILTGFRQFLDTLEPADRFPAMRAMTVTGEPLHREDIERFDLVFEQRAALTNLHASTEHPMISSFTPDRSALPLLAGVVPLGFPTPGTNPVLLGENGDSVQQGAIGEVAVRGTMLGAGYLHDPALSAKVWQRDPAMPGGLIARTGDLAMMDAKGCLHGRGRADQQAKIRGYRVVPGEIENVLVEHPAIRAAAVVRDQIKPGSDRLVGYIIAQTDSVPTTSELRGYLGRRLPDYMVPAVFMPVTDFDLTASGKIDRRALPPPAIDIHARSGDVVAPANDVEATIKEIWEELLGVAGLSVEDDFFLIGGDSVLAMTMFLKMEQRLERQLPFESLWLQGSTIRALAKTVSGDVPETDWGQALPMQTNGDKPALFFVSKHAVPVFCLSLIPYLGADQPVFGLPAKGVSGDALPDRRIEDMAAHCIAMMRQAQPDGPYRIMGHSNGGLVAFEAAQTLRRQGVDVSKLVILDSGMPGSARSLAAKVLRRPFRALRFGGSLVGQALGLSAPGGSATRQAAQTSAHFRYRPKPYPGDAVLILASERLNTTELVQRWRRLIKGDLVVAEVPGDHISMLQEPGIGELARTLMRLLED